MCSPIAGRLGIVALLLANVHVEFSQRANPHCIRHPDCKKVRIVVANLIVGLGGGCHPTCSMPSVDDELYQGRRHRHGQVPRSNKV